MTDPNIWNTAIKMPLGGYWYGLLGSVGDVGDFWSSVANDSGDAYAALANSVGNVYPGYNYDRSNGNSVRCIAR